MARLKKSAQQSANQRVEPPARPRLRRRVVQQDMPNMLPLFLIAIGLLAIFQWQVSALFFVFMVPTFVMSFTALDARKNERVLCVGLMNIAGIMPFAMEVWDYPARFEFVASNVINIAVMLGSASMGYLLLWIGPIIAAIVLQALAADKIKALTSKRKSFVEEWGPEVLGDKRPD